MTATSSCDNPLEGLDLEDTGGSDSLAASGQDGAAVGSPPKKARMALKVGSERKKRRGGHRLVKTEKQEEDAPDGGALAEFEELEAEGEDDPDCTGCARTPEADCWICPGDKVVWGLPMRDGKHRGRWCRECFTVWRLQFSHRIKIAFMQGHMQRDAKIVAEFEIALVSFISLRKEGIERVAATKLHSRMELIEWALRCFGIPAEAFVVLPISALAGRDVNPDRLVSIRNEGGFHIGAMVPPLLDVGTPTFKRPRLQHDIALKSRSSLLTSSQADADFLGELSGIAPHEMKKVAVKQEVDIGTPSPHHMSKSAKKALASLRSAIAGAELLLPAFASDDWQDLRESAFTAIAAKLMSAKLDVAHEQLDAHIKVADAWHTDISNVKHLIKKYKELEKTKKGCRNAKMGMLADAATQSWAFMQKSMTPGRTFHQFRLKCAFFAGEDIGLAPRLRAQAAVGLWEQVKEWDGGIAATRQADGFLCVLALDYICPTIEAMPLVEVGVCKVELSEDIANAIAIMAISPVSELLSEVTMDLQHTESLLRAGSTGVGAPTYERLIAAEAHIASQQRLALLKQALSSGAGQEIMAPLQNMKIASTNDALANQQFELGMGTVEATEMLRVELRMGTAEEEAADPYYRIFNVDCLSGSPMNLEGMMEDAFANVCEGIQRWPDWQRLQQANEIRWFFRLVDSILCAADFSFLVMMAEACWKHFVEMRACVDAEKRFDMAALQAASVSIGVALESTVPKAATTNLRKMLTNICSDLDGLPAVKAQVTSTIRVSKANHDSKDKVFSILKLVWGDWSGRPSKKRCACSRQLALAAPAIFAGAHDCAD